MLWIPEGIPRPARGRCGAPIAEGGCQAMGNGLQGYVQASGFFRFGVKSLHPIGSVVHLKSVRKQRVSFCPLQE